MEFGVGIASSFIPCDVCQRLFREFLFLDGKRFCLECWAKPKEPEADEPLILEKKP